MDFSACQHLSYDMFCYPYDRDTLVISLKTGKDVDKVCLVYGDPFSGGILGGNWSWKGEKEEIRDKKELQHNYLWTIEIEPRFKRCKYYFEIFSGNEKWIYLEDGFYSPQEFDNIKGRPATFIYPWMNENDINKTPEWAENTIWYQIFPDRFCNGDKSIDPENVLPWKTSKDEVFTRDEYGGDLQGIIDKLDYLSNLGITGIYLNPVNAATSNHRYDTNDYYTIDKRLGTNEKMAELGREAHKRGIKIMLDGVFNHCGWFFPQWQDVVKNGPDSKYFNWFMVNQWPFDTDFTNARKGKFYAFAFADFMPKLNTNNPEVQEYLISACEMWVKEYGMDALRLDVANEISHEFCKKLRQRMLALNPEFYIVGEIWHNAMPWMRGDEFDSVMNYPLQDAVSTFWLNENETSEQMEWQINLCHSMYMKQTEKVMFNLLDSHDTIRLVTACKSKNKALQQFALLFSITGSTCIYYGTEILLEGAHDPDCRRCMPWPEIENGDFDGFLGFFKKLINLRKTEAALRDFEIKFIHNPESPRILHIQKKDSAGRTINLICNCSKKDLVFPAEKDKVLLENLYSDNVIHPDGLVMYLS